MMQKNQCSLISTILIFKHYVLFTYKYVYLYALKHGIYLGFTNKINDTLIKPPFIFLN